MSRGVDRGGAQWAKAQGLPVVEAPALWNKYGQREAGFIRNQWMAWYATHLLAIWDGESRGTLHMIRTAESNGLAVQVVLTEQQHMRCTEDSDDILFNGMNLSFPSASVQCQDEGSI